MPDLLAYESHHAVVVDAIRYAIPGPQSPDHAAREAVQRLRTEPFPLSFDGLDSDRLHAVIAAAVSRGAQGELDLDEAAHVALDGLRDLGVPIGPRPPNDPFPDL